MKSTKDSKFAESIVDTIRGSEKDHYILKTAIPPLPAAEKSNDISKLKTW